ncbi:MAG: hypothetical protein RL338_219 [Chloroflexota bacterium]
MTLISVDALRDRIADPGLRLVDVRWYLGRPGEGRRAYEAGHLPGAAHLDLDTDLAGSADDGPGRHPLPSPAAFAERLGGVGIGDGSTVVAYDDVGGWVAARLWWMLDRIGHPSCAVLDGGLGAWVERGLPLETVVPAWPRATLAVRGAAAVAADGGWPGTIARDELRRRLGGLVLLDARAGARYRGETEPVDPVAGHIPTAVSVPTDGNLGPDGRFLRPDALRRRFVELGADGSREVVTSCGSGVSACHNALAMRAAGLPDPILYPGSWSDWSTAGYPVATGPEPGDPA